MALDTGSTAIDRFLAFIEKSGDGEVPDAVSLCIGAFEKLDDDEWNAVVKEYFGH